MCIFLERYSRTLRFSQNKHPDLVKTVTIRQEGYIESGPSFHYPISYLRMSFALDSGL